MSDVYAKIKDGKVIEYPVSIEQIQARGVPVSWYVKCEFDEKPEVDEFTFVYQVPIITDTNGVRVTWKTDSLTLESLLVRLPSDDLTNPGNNKFNRRPNKISNKPPSTAMINRIKQLTEEKVQAYLDNFARLKGYDTIERAITYIGDKNPVWDAEGKICRDIRSDTWSKLQAYFDDVTATPQRKPYPNRWQDIANNLPSLSWPVEAP